LSQTFRQYLLRLTRSLPRMPVRACARKAGKAQVDRRSGKARRKA
jgi:histone H3/H4